MAPFGKKIIEQLHIHTNLESLLVGSVSIGGLLGCVVSAKVADRIGRKLAIGISFGFISTGWFIVTCSSNVSMILVGRILHGLGEGSVVAVGIIYLGETIEEKYRGGAIASVTVTCIFGIAFAYALGLVLPWRLCSGCITGLNIICLLGSTALRESSHWQNMQEELKQNAQSSNRENKPSSAKNTIISTCVPPFLLFLCPITGVYSIGFYAISLMDSMSVGQPAVVAIGVGLVRTLGSACGSVIVQKYGRRKTLLFSSIPATMLLFSVSTLLYLQSSLPPMVHSLSLVSLLVMVMFSNSVGMTPVPWILCGEWPDTQYKVREGLAF